MGEWGDGGLWGDGTLYGSPGSSAVEYSVEREVHCHRLSLRLKYTAVSTPGGDDSIRINDLRVRLSPDRQVAYGHESFVDAVTPSERLACVVRHRGSEFIISNIQMIVQHKKKQPKG